MKRTMLFGLVLVIVALVIVACSTPATAPAPASSSSAPVSSAAPSSSASASSAVSSSSSKVSSAASSSSASASSVASSSSASASSPKDIKGMKMCYLIGALSNTFLNNLTSSVKKRAAAEGVDVSVYGADEGGATQQYSQIENCISMKVNLMIIMAAGDVASVLPAVQEAHGKGIMVIGVPPGQLAPFDAIMHTDQTEDGTKIAQMACDFINKTYPTAADHSVETAIIGNPTAGAEMKQRNDGMETIKTNCAKAKVVQENDQADQSIAGTAAVAENILTAHPNIKVFLVESSSGAQGVAQTIKALPNVDASKYGVFAGDMDPTMIPVVTGCKDPYKGLVAIGGPALDETTWNLAKKMLQGVDYPKITNDVLVPMYCGMPPQ